MNKRSSQHSRFYEALGTNIQKHRNRLNLSQATLSRLVNLTRTSLTNIEKGRQHPPVYTLCEIAEHLKVDISELVPRLPPTEEAPDVRTLAAGQGLRENELRFIEAAIKGGQSHVNTKKDNRGKGRKTSRG